MAITQIQKDYIVGLVVGMFNAAPGANNLRDLSNAIESGVSFEELADILEATPEFQQGILKGNVTFANKVSVLMNNFGLTPGNTDPASADAQAEAFFAARLLQGASIGDIVIEAGLYLLGNPAEEFADVAALFQNKILVAGVYSRENSADSVAALQAILAGVTATFPTTEAEALEYLAGTLTGDTFLLTTAQDNIVGTAANDTISGIADGASSTLTLGDTINGGAGIDTLQIVIGQETLNLGIATISNVENLVADIRHDGFDTMNMANNAFARATLDFNNMVHNDSVDVENVNRATTVEIKNVDLNGNTVWVDYAGSDPINSGLALTNVADGSVDVSFNHIDDLAQGSYTVTLGNVQDVDLDFDDDGAALELNVVVNGDSEGIEIRNYNSTAFAGADAVVNVTLNANLQVDWWDLSDDSDSTTAFNIAGAGNLTIDDLDDGSSEVTVNGETATGNIDITFGADNVVSVTTGSGDDRVVLDNDYFVADSELVVNLGAGSNTLGISDVTSDAGIAALDFSDVTLSGVTALEFADDITLAADATLDLNGVGDNIERLVLADFNGAGFEFSIENTTPAFAIEANADLYDTFLSIDNAQDLAISANEYLDIEDLNAPNLVNLSLQASDLVEAYLGHTAGYDLSSLETLTVTGADLDEESYHWVEINDGASALTTVTVTGNWSGLYVDGAESLETVTLTGGSDFYGDDAYLEVYNAESLTSATLTGVEAYVYLENTPAFTTLDISGIEEDAYIDVSLADFDGAVTILIGGSDVEYWADTLGNQREVFQFVGEDIGAIEINVFLAGVGNNGDRLDFSAFAGVSGLDDLNINYDGSNTVVTSDAFEGTITVVGVDISTDAFNFIF